MLKSPLISEKSMGLVKNGFYTFVVGADATKQGVARLVKERFKVDVVSVRVVNVVGKKKSQKTRKGYYLTASIKKAIVKLKSGQKIPLFEAPASDAASAVEEVTVRTAEGGPIAKTREKKSLLRGTKVKIEEAQLDGVVKRENNSKKSRQQSGKTGGK